LREEEEVRNYGDSRAVLRTGSIAGSITSMDYFANEDVAAKPTLLQNEFGMQRER